MQTVNLSENDWRRRLSPAQYHVLREAGTEPAFSGRYTDTDVDGRYCCAGCATPVFDSTDKYDSGTGWPCFTRAIDGRVTEHGDCSRGTGRIEARCACCDGHLGHIFADGPVPDGRRYCINSLSLDLKPRRPANG